MTTNFERVKEFMRAMDQMPDTCGMHVPTPIWPDELVQAMRLRLIHEEVGELQAAIKDRDIVEVADALADILYVVYGAAVSFNIDLDRCFREVHRSNMTKLGPDGKPIKDATGKIMKGPKYQPPDLGPALNLPVMDTRG